MFLKNLCLSSLLLILFGLQADYQLPLAMIVNETAQALCFEGCGQQVVVPAHGTRHFLGCRMSLDGEIATIQTPSNVFYMYVKKGSFIVSDEMGRAYVKIPISPDRLMSSSGLLIVITAEGLPEVRLLADFEQSVTGNFYPQR